MPKPSSTPRTANGYQKYFDVRSLKSVASCAAMIFIIVHLIDYLGNFTMSLRILDIITLGICLLVTFLFVVNELGKLEEKIILGVANAALLFFSVIGFNSTATSSLVREKRNHRQYEASFFPFFSVRNWMPPAELEKKVDTLANENRLLRQVNQLQRDSLASLRSSPKDSSGHYQFEKEKLSAQVLKWRLASLII
jgi:hypothetical protein